MKYERICGRGHGVYWAQGMGTCENDPESLHMIRRGIGYTTESKGH
jgi:hypothetical protein